MVDPTFFILVVDNDQQVVDILQRVGQTEFPEALFVGVDSSQGALDYLAGNPLPRPHLILLDTYLHGPINGLDLITELQVYSKRLIPIIVFTMSDTEQEVALAYNRGAVAYIRKSYAFSDWKAYAKLLRDYWFSTASLPEHMQ